MLPARHRLRRREDFSRAVRGRRSGSALLVVHVSASQPTVPECRVGFVVSKAVGNAVVRNKVKRRLRAAVATRIDDLPEGHDVVVRANPPAATVPFADLEKDLDRSLRTALRKVGGPGSRGVGRAE